MCNEFILFIALARGRQKVTLPPNKDCLRGTLRPSINDLRLIARLPYKRNSCTVE